MRSVKKELEFKTNSPFLIREDSLNRLIEIIRSFYLGIGVKEDDIRNHTTFEAICADNAIITTDEIQEILSLENHGSTSIKKLSVYCNTYKNQTGVQYKIEFRTFDSPDKIIIVNDNFYSINVHVESDNPENCVRFMNSLRTYVENSIYFKHSVCFTKLFWYSQRTHVTVFTPAILMAILGVTILLIFKSNVYSPSRIILTIFTSVFTLLTIILNMKTSIIASRLPYIFDFGTNPEDYKDRTRIIKFAFSIFGTVFLGIVSALLYDIIFK